MFGLFVVGPPGVGKTTLVRALMTELDPMGTAYMTPRPKWTVAPGAFAAAGHYTGGTFDGADTVPYTGVSQALDFLEQNIGEWKPRVVVFDGDRFSHDSAKARIASMMLVTALHAVAPEEVLAARRKARGSNQDPTWMKGRATKAARFVESFKGGSKTCETDKPDAARLFVDWVLSLPSA